MCLQIKPNYTHKITHVNQREKKTRSFDLIPVNQRQISCNFKKKKSSAPLTSVHFSSQFVNWETPALKIAANDADGLRKKIHIKTRWTKLSISMPIHPHTNSKCGKWCAAWDWYKIAISKVRVQQQHQLMVGRAGGWSVKEKKRDVNSISIKFIKCTS